MKEYIRIRHWITSDYFVFVTLTTCIIFTIVSVYNYFWGEEAVYTISIWFGIGAVLFLVAFIVRIVILLRLARYGEETNATIKSIYFFRGRGRVSFEFTYQDSLVTAGWGLVRNSRSKVLKSSSVVRILFNPMKPKQAIILDVLKLNR